MLGNPNPNPVYEAPAQSRSLICDFRCIYSLFHMVQCLESSLMPIPRQDWWVVLFWGCRYQRKSRFKRV
jgi:hypothetical protein